MKNHIAVGLGFGYIALFLSLHFLGFIGLEKKSIFLSLLILVLIGFFTLHNYVTVHKRYEKYGLNFILCLKEMMKYVLIVGLFTFVYFKWINPEFLQSRMRANVELELAKDFEEIKTHNSLLKDLSKEEYIEKVKGSAAMIASPGLNASFYFFGMTLISLFYSLIIPAIYKVILVGSRRGEASKHHQ